MPNNELPDYSERLKKAMQFVADTRGSEVVEAMEKRWDSLGRRYSEHSLATSYGEAYQRDGIDLKLREMVSLGILAAIGGTSEQVAIHTHYALALGLTPEEIVEVMIQVSVYAGAARASVAMFAVKKTFDEHGIPVP